MTNDLKSSLKLNKIEGINVWGNLEKEWPELLFSTVKCPKISPIETERQREERLNHVIRMPLLAEYSDPQNPPNIIVSRACKYKTEVVKHSLSTPEIESILKTPSNEHLDCFYLTIKLRNIPSTARLPQHITGDWRVVEPVTAFPYTYIGHFPKKRFETERERVATEQRNPSTSKEISGRPNYKGVSGPGHTTARETC